MPVKDGAEGMAQLDQSKVDGYAGDRVVLAGLRLRARKPEAFDFVGEDFSYEPYALVLPRNDADFRLAVNTRARKPLSPPETSTRSSSGGSAISAGPACCCNAMFYLNTLPE